MLVEAADLAIMHEIVPALQELAMTGNVSAVRRRGWLSHHRKMTSSFVDIPTKESFVTPKPTPFNLGQDRLWPSENAVKPPRNARRSYRRARRTDYKTASPLGFRPPQFEHHIGTTEKVY
jgi:hypothetical protein